MKEAYFKLKGDFSDDDFKKIRADDINLFHHIIRNKNFICIIFCEKEDDILFFN